MTDYYKPPITNYYIRKRIDALQAMERPPVTTQQDAPTVNLKGGWLAVSHRGGR